MLPICTLIYHKTIAPGKIRQMGYCQFLGGGSERTNNPVISSTLQEEEGIMVEGFSIIEVLG
jgi:hypothetical protein